MDVFDGRQARRSGEAGTVLQCGDGAKALKAEAKPVKFPKSSLERSPKPKVLSA